MAPDQIQPEPVLESPDIVAEQLPTDTDQADVIVPQVADLEIEPAAELPAMPEVAFSWRASEFVHHHKSMVWYAVVAMAVIVLATLAVWLHFWLEIGVFVIAGVAVIVYARKAPRTLLYELSSEGVHIDGKLYPFSTFRSFGVIPDEEWHSIDLEPARRFIPRLVLLFDTPDLDEIVDHLELHLPREDRTPDLIERISRYVRF